MTIGGSAAGLDPRLVAARPDLARAGLERQVTADRFVTPDRAMVRVGVAALRRAPRASAPLDTEVLFGETVAVLENKDGWCWLQLDRDGYVGYVESTALTNEIIEPTHRIKALATYIYPEPNIKAPPIAELSLGARVRIVGFDDTLARLASGGYVPTRHATEVDRVEFDFVDVAERFVGSPYLWGGRTRRGLDCSGLVQTAMHAAGFGDTHRDSHMQETTIGTPVLVPENLEGLKRGDLVFWPGHVAIMLDDLMMLHANAHHMSVVAEPLSTAVARIGRNGTKLSSIRRPPALSAASTDKSEAQA